ncbi:hypothetical protein SESBI_44761 [Sesbania bispinosa]|nr:hypothetical protein SESBI_44761 [Sesbania bispinosa]
MGMQNMPRPRGADAAGLLLRELELHPPAEEWHRRNIFGGPWSDHDADSANDAPKLAWDYLGIMGSRRDVLLHCGRQDLKGSGTRGFGGSAVGLMAVQCVEEHGLELYTAAFTLLQNCHRCEVSLWAEGSTA